MTTLARDEPRTYYGPKETIPVPVIAADIIYEGAAIGDNASGYGRPLVAADPFMGFAFRKADNSTGAAGAINVEAVKRGYIRAYIGSLTQANVDADVYMSDDNTFTLTSTSNSKIGKIAEVIDANYARVYFEAVSNRVT